MPLDINAVFQNQPIMAILRNMDANRAVALANNAWDLGIELVEVPIQDTHAVPSLAAVVKAGAERGKIVGAGTITSGEQVRQSADLGAAFTVAPGLDKEVVETCHEMAIPHLPGISTPSEIQAAVRLGCTMVKAFPASSLGTQWFRAMRGPFPSISFVATGGMDASNADAYLAAGASTVAVGSALADESQLDQLAKIIATCRQLGSGIAGVHSPERG